MRLHDSRRLTGPNRYGDRPGAVLEVSAPAEAQVALIAAWQQEVRRLLDAVGWQTEAIAARRFANGVGLAISAPIDLLYAATEINEAALANVLGGRSEGAGTMPDEGMADAAASIAELQGAIASEARPAARVLQAAAAGHRVHFLWGDGEASVGLGAGAVIWPVDQIPAPDDVPWPKVYDIPVVAVTGTNGKSTSVRLVAAMIAAADLTPGCSSTDGVRVGREWTVRGDYSGPEGARRVLRHPRVQAAVLETARGGLVRRGLGAWPLDAALVTNLAPDHLGEFGLSDIADLANVKLVIARQVRSTGRVVLNADDALLVSIVCAAERQTAGAEAALTSSGAVAEPILLGPIVAPISWFSLDAANPIVKDHVAAGGDAAWLQDGAIWLAKEGAIRQVVAVSDIPITLGGAVRYNVANALGAAALGAAIGLSTEAIAQGLTRFTSTPDDNPGRANLFEFGGLTALVDYAHNPHGLDALYDTVMALPARRRLVVLGQAGDRDDEAIREMARAAARYMPDHIIVKDLPLQMRGRAPGEVPGILRDELLAVGCRPDQITYAASELEATRQALAWSQPGDLLVLLTYAERPEVLALLTGLAERRTRSEEALVHAGTVDPVA